MKILNISLLIIGVLHLLIGLVIHWEVLKNIAGSHFVNSVDGHVERGEAFWYFMSGFMVITSGLLIHYFIRETGKPVPAPVGLSLTLISFVGIVLMPASGFWLFLPQALFILINGKNKGR